MLESKALNLKLDNLEFNLKIFPLGMEKFYEKNNQCSSILGTCITMQHAVQAGMMLFRGVSACSDSLMLAVWFSYSGLIPHVTSAVLFLFFSLFSPSDLSGTS